MKLNQSECSISTAQNHFTRTDRRDLGLGDQVRFNDALDNLTQKVIFKGTISFKKELDLFRESSLNRKDPIAKTIEGNVLDLLIVGVFWNEYHDSIPKNPKSKRSLLVNLIHFNSQSRKEATKFEILKGKSSESNEEFKKADEVSLDQFNKLVDWLLSQREFRNEAERIQLWNLFFEFYPKAFFENLFPRIVAFSQWFMQETNRVVGEIHLFPNGNNGVENRFPGNDLTTDLRSSQALSYLNLIGAAIFNRAEKNIFESTKYKSVVLPSRMVKKQNCQAMIIDNIRYCGHCSTTCPVSVITRKMNSQGVETVVVEQDDSFYKRINKYSEKNFSGLVLASDFLNSLESAFTMKKEGIPAQIVRLDQVWNDNNTLINYEDTNVSLYRLAKIVQ